MFSVSRECLYQIRALIPVILYEFTIGLGIGWVAPTLSQMLRDKSDIGLSITNDQASWIASLSEFTRILLPLFTIPLLNAIGRRGALTFAALLCLVSSALIALVKSVPAIYFSRLVFGAANGVYIPAASLYLCENFKPTYRGAVGATLIAFCYGGSLLEFCLVNYLTYETTAYVNMTIAVLALFTHFLSVETPEYLLSRGRNEEALENFLRLRGAKIASAALMDEFYGVKKCVQKEGEGEERSIRTFLATSAHRKTVAIVLLFNLLASATGINPIMSYVSITFVEDVLTSTEYTILFGALQLAAALLGAAVIERVNRRTFLTFSLLVSVFAHLGTATFLYCQKERIDVSHLSWCLFATVTMYAMAFSSCILPNVFLIAGELFPQSARSFGSGVSIFSFALVGFLETKGFLLVDQCWNFVFYATVSLVFAIFVWAVLPENRGKSLAQIQTEIDVK